MIIGAIHGLPLGMMPMPTSASKIFGSKKYGNAEAKTMAVAHC